MTKSDALARVERKLRSLDKWMPSAKKQNSWKAVGRSLTFVQFVNKVYPRYVWYRHCQVLATVLQEVADGKRKRVMVFMAPRHGKSILSSRLFAAYMVYRYPDKFVAIASYGMELAQTFSRAARQHFEDSGQVLEGAKSVKHWETPQGGGLWAAGVGGSATGRGFGSCFPEDVMVATEMGKIRIRTLCQLQHPPRVLSFNHESRRLEWKRIVATSVRSSQNFIQISTDKGNTLRCTPEHPIFSVECGYRQAIGLVPGQTVIQIESLPKMRGLRLCDFAGNHMPPLLRQSSELSICGDLPFVRKSIRENSIRNRKSIEERPYRFLLQQGLCSSAPFSEESSNVQILQSSPDFYEIHLPLQRLQKKALVFPIQKTAFFQSIKQFCAKIKRHKVWALFRYFSCPILKECLLFKRLSECRSFKANDWAREQPLQKWNKLRPVVQGDGSSHQGKGQSFLCSVRVAGKDDANEATIKEWGMPGSVQHKNSPYRRKSEKQFSRESSNVVRWLPWHSSQDGRCWQAVPVSSNEELCGAFEPVYDIQVEGNHNFFANEILVHNCGIIDDPIKSAEEAASETIKAKQKDWYSSVFYTRAEPDAAIVLIQTRWAEDDLAGWLLKQEQDEEPENWHIVNFEAIKEILPPEFPPSCTVEPDWRSPGEALCPERYDLRKLQKFRARISDYFFSALYQQRPRPMDGNMIKLSWFGRYRVPPESPKMIVLSWDTASKAKELSAYSVCTVWAVTDSGFYVLDMWRDRVEMPTLERMVISLGERWKPNAILIEDKASGTGVIQLVQAKAWLPIVPIEPQSDKLTRLAVESPAIEAGRVWLPEHAPWLPDFEKELISAPNGAFMDICDSVSQFLCWMRSQYTNFEFSSSGRKYVSDTINDYMNL
jgi:predicted phage terminase large subunit-like protein